MTTTDEARKRIWTAHDGAAQAGRHTAHVRLDDLRAILSPTADVAGLVGRLSERLQIRWGAPDKDGAIHQLVDADDLRATISLITGMGTERRLAEGDEGPIIQFMSDLHSHLPDDQRPCGWASFSDAQAERIRIAGAKLIEAIRRTAPPAGVSLEEEAVAAEIWAVIWNEVGLGQVTPVMFANSGGPNRRAYLKAAQAILARLTKASTLSEQGEGLDPKLVRLVIAGRIAFEQFSQIEAHYSTDDERAAMRELDQALEAYAEAVPYDNGPEAAHGQ